MIDIVDINC